MKALITIIGTFHFANPGNDAIKVDQIDVMTSTSQAYLEQMTKQLASFRPTAILNEVTPEQEDAINEEYRAYLNGNFELGVSELYQLAFRIGKKAGLESIKGIDEPGPNMKFGELQKYMTEKDPAALRSFEAMLVSDGEAEAKKHATMTLEELLVGHNGDEEDRANKAIYLETNDVGASDGWAGADAASAWWNRNFRMYALIQKHIEPGARLIVIAGGGHTAILKDLARIDANVELVDARNYL